MTSHNHTRDCLTAITPDGILILSSSPIILNWIPRDIVNDAYNFGGIVTVGTFDSIEDAKQAGKQRYSVSFEEWRVGDYLEFERNLSRAEVHTPEIDGHKVLRHDIRWK
jgi:hypothetical protein